jgi:hypothetical protein
VRCQRGLVRRGPEDSALPKPDVTRTNTEPEPEAGLCQFALKPPLHCTTTMSATPPANDATPIH